MLIRNNPEVLRYIKELDETAVRRNMLFTTINGILENATIFVDEGVAKAAKDEYGDLYIKKLIADTLQVEPSLIDDDLALELNAKLTVLDKSYYEDFYVQTIRDVDNTVCGITELTSSKVDKGHVDYCKCPNVTGAIPAAPNLYYAPKEFSLLQLWIREDLWMTLSPNEVYTMKEHVDKAVGKVLTCGLGIGYYAIMAAARGDVQSVTVVEHEECVIRMFVDNIAPRFPKHITDKIHIVHGNAYDYLYKVVDGDFNYCFVDLWQGVQDTDLYFKAIHATAHFKKTKYGFWIEDSFICRFRDEILAAMANTVDNMPLSAFIYPFMEKVIVSTESGVSMWLSAQHIRNHIYSCVRKIPKQHMDAI